jgi:hypothetical protein
VRTKKEAPLDQHIHSSPGSYITTPTEKRNTHVEKDGKKWDEQQLVVIGLVVAGTAFGLVGLGSCNVEFLISFRLLLFIGICKMISIMAKKWRIHNNSTTWDESDVSLPIDVYITV